ncbi:MAG: ATP-dependent protease ATPase subunit HslU [Phycisphaeraceae bacterium]|nr:ATP-dependent protease ATPase subunit HslU [Phycisphaeraceae bacterium]
MASSPATSLTPRRIVAELDRYIIGQQAAKHAVAVAIRNRWRRQQLPPDVAQEIPPKNIIMVGPTGVGKTEIARRLATLTGAPFVKVEASRYTEVGYHGRDVESMVRDLLEQALQIVRAEQAESVREKAAPLAVERLIDVLLPPAGSSTTLSSASITATDDSLERREHARGRLREQLASGALDGREVEITVASKPSTPAVFAGMGLDQMDPDMANMFERLMPAQSKRRRVTVAEARRILTEQETDKLLDRDKITTEAIRRTEQSGIIFLDEIDKIATPGGSAGHGSGASGGGGGGPDVSRQGVQRDLLPIVEGSTVNTRHGLVKTDHILFIAAGAFHSAAVSDLMPELQGRFPIRVELSPLGKDDFVRILTEPGNALTRQQQSLLGVEGLDVRFDPAAIETMADLAARANATMENIGARRLMTIVEKVFEQINFDAPERVEQGRKELTITAEFVQQQVGPILGDEDLSRFVL